MNVDPATNRITTGGYSYDANGNLTAMPSLALIYDVENRVAQTVGSGTEQYVYDPGNLRVWKHQANGWNLVYFYGIDGNLLGTYGDDANYDYNVYFGSKQIWQEWAAGRAAGPVNSDRLDSNVKHFPYGEEGVTSSQNRQKFATYYRDSSTALDYARNRYYARTIGRFTSVDPLGGSLAKSPEPQSLLLCRRRSGEQQRSDRAEHLGGHLGGSRERGGTPIRWASPLRYLGVGRRVRNFCGRHGSAAMTSCCRRCVWERNGAMVEPESSHRSSARTRAGAVQWSIR